jgi:predicted RNase H-like nuclease (RuvC/YqgF family)
MEHFERYFKLRAKAGEVIAAIQELRSQLLEEEKRHGELEEEATQAAILENKGTDRLAREVADKAIRIEDLKREIAEKEKAIGILEKSLGQGSELWREAFEEVRAKFRPLLAGAARAFFKKLQEAEEAEKEIVRITNEAIRQGGQLGAGFSVVPGLKRICVGSNFMAGDLTPMYEFARDCKTAKIDLE